MRQDGGTRLLHVWRGGVVAGQLQGIVGLDAGAHVEIATIEQRPAAVLALGVAQVVGDLALDHVVDLAEVVLEQDEFRGDRRIRLEIELPMAIRRLAPLQRGLRFGDGRFQPFVQPVGLGRAMS